MNYEAWRMAYQDSEQAARAAFKLACELSSEVKELKSDKLAQDAAYNAMMAQRDAAVVQNGILRRAIEYSNSYLCESQLNTIGHGSKAHYEMKNALDECKIQSEANVNNE